MTSNEDTWRGRRADARPERSDARRPGSDRNRRGESTRGRGRVQTDLLHSNLANEPISRQGVLMAGLGLAGMLVAARLADFQLINADRYQSEANARRLSSQKLYAKRGTIYDRNGTVLASSVECKNVYINPQLIEKGQRKKAISALVEVLGVDKDFVSDLLDLDTTFAYVKRQVDDADAEILAKKNIAGIEFEPSIKRVYPNGSLASQVLGIVNVDNVGVSGLEKQYNDILTGVDGSLVRERALDGTFIAGGAYKKVPAEDGMDIVLGIDANIQRVAEDALARSSASSTSITSASRAWKSSTTTSSRASTDPWCASAPSTARSSPAAPTRRCRPRTAWTASWASMRPASAWRRTPSRRSRSAWAPRTVQSW